MKDFINGRKLQYIYMKYMNIRSYNIYVEHFCILYTDFRSWIIILVESAPLGGYLIVAWNVAKQWREILS